MTSRKQDVMTDLGEEEETKQRFHHSGSGRGAFEIGEVYSRLIEVGEQLLKPGGRLVFFYHTDEAKSDSCEGLIERIKSGGKFAIVDIAASEFLKKRKRHMLTL